MSLFQKATKTQRNLRLAIYGASGSGKTYTALAIASGFGGSVALIDTENSADLYADFGFDIAPLAQPTIDNVVEYMRAAIGYKTLIIDSFSHPWKELLDEVGQIARAKYNGNTHSAWSQGNEKQNKLINAVLKFPGHLIVTMRSKTEWMIEEYESGGRKKNKPVRLGLAPVQGKDIEYEFDMLMQISPDHFATFDKDRTGKFQDRVIEKPGKEFGQELIKWLQSAPAKEKPSEPSTPPSNDAGSANGSASSFINELLDEKEKEAAQVRADKKTDARKELADLLTESYPQFDKIDDCVALVKSESKSVKDLATLSYYYLFFLADCVKDEMPAILKDVSTFKGDKGDVFIDDPAKLFKTDFQKKNDKWLRSIYGSLKTRIEKKLKGFVDEPAA